MMAWGKCKEHEEKGHRPQRGWGRKGGVAVEVTANQERAESPKPEERVSKIRVI